MSLPTLSRSGPSGKARMVQLDVLRGIAILLVLGRHAPISSHHAGLLRPLAGLWARIGWTGVDLFFVLSGFLVGGLLLSELRTHSRLDLGRFLVRRSFKIWPAYYVYLTCAVVLEAVRYHEPLWREFASHIPSVVQLQNYSIQEPGHLWSLAVEEHFYLVLPALLAVLTAARWRNLSVHMLPVIACLVIAACIAFRCLVLPHHPYSVYTHMLPTHLRVDGLFFGVLLSYVYHFQDRLFTALTRRRDLLLATGICLISPMAILEKNYSPFVWTIGYTLLYVGYGCILMPLVQTRLGEGIVGRALQRCPALGTGGCG